jgi:STE24 endopeptidase
MKCLFLLLFLIALGNDHQKTDREIHLIFRVLDWKLESVIGIEYPGKVPRKQAEGDIIALAQLHNWKFFDESLDVYQENGRTLAWLVGLLSQKHLLSTSFTLNFQVVRKLFHGYETIIVDIIGKRGFAYQSFLTPDTSDWRKYFEISKSWIGMMDYRVRYIFHPPQIPETLLLPTLMVKASLSVFWLLKVFPILIFLILIPGITAYLLLQRGVSLDKRGKVRLSPIQTLIINSLFPLIVLATVHLGCTNVCAALTRNLALGYILSAGTVGISSFVIYGFVLHRHERAVRGTTWTFRENLLTSSRATAALGGPAILLLPCLAVTLRFFPRTSIWIFGLIALIEYSFLTFLFACLMPFLIRWIWKGEPLKDVEIRRQLETLARRAGVTYRDVILLHTKRSKLANAWVSGILPKLRFLFISDYLIENLTPQEIEAVLAHELGHLKHCHLFKQIKWIVFSFGGGLILAWLSYWSLRRLPLPSWMFWLSFSLINFIPIALVIRIGVMNFWRQMEFEADAYAVELTCRPDAFIQALRKLILLNDVSRDLSRADEMLSTHPIFQARIAAINRLNC